MGAGPRGGVVLLRGDAGSGKTRLIREFAGGAVGRGVLVLYGPCDSVINTPYQPITQALGVLTDAGEGDLRRILPHLGTDPDRAVDPDTERYRLHAAVADLLAGIATERPVVFVLDDAHWADVASLHLVRHLATTVCRASRLLLLVAFRDDEPDRRTAFTATLADLIRRDQRRCGRALVVLVPHRRPYADLLPVRGRVDGWYSLLYQPKYPTWDRCPRTTRIASGS